MLNDNSTCLQVPDKPLHSKALAAQLASKQLYANFGLAPCKIKPKSAKFDLCLAIIMNYKSVAQIAWSTISVNIYDLIEKFRNETRELCPAVPDMRYAGNQLDDQKIDLASYISILCGKVERNNKYPNICRVVIPFKYTYT